MLRYLDGVHQNPLEGGLNGVATIGGLYVQSSNLVGKP
jgi:hypothetical protein